MVKLFADIYNGNVGYDIIGTVCGNIYRVRTVNIQRCAHILYFKIRVSPRSAPLILPDRHYGLIIADKAASVCGKNDIV